MYNQIVEMAMLVVGLAHSHLQLFVVHFPHLFLRDLVLHSLAVGQCLVVKIGFLILQVLTMLVMRGTCQVLPLVVDTML